MRAKLFQEIRVKLFTYAGVLALATASVTLHAEAAEAIEFNLPAQNLEGAIKDYAVATNRQVMVYTELQFAKAEEGGNGSFRLAQATTQTSGTVGTVSENPSAAMPAHRQSNLEEVIVTARRREEGAQSVPIAVTALSADTLETFKIENLDDLQYYDPSFSVSASSGRPNSPVYSLRGVRPTEALYGQDPTVAVYLADVVLSPAQGSNLGMYDLASVQVLKGPQGTLFGRNTTGGAILLTPRRPGDTLGGHVMVGYGNFGAHESQFAVDFPVSEKLALRLSGKATDSDGYQTNVAPGPLFGDKLGGGETRSVRLSALWDVTDDIENYTILTWDELDLNGPQSVLQAVRPASTAGSLYNGQPPLNLPSLFDVLERAQGRDARRVEAAQKLPTETEVWGVINTTTMDIGDDLTLKSTLGYRNMDAFQILDTTGSPILDINTGYNYFDLEHTSYELQLLGTALDKKLEWVTGIYWYYEDGFQDGSGNVLAAVNPNNPFIALADMHNQSYSLFAHGSYQLADDWSVSAGARWTYDEKQLIISTGNPVSCGLTDPQGNTLPLDDCFVDLEESFDQPTGSVSLEYSPTADLMIYSTGRLGYRAGGFNARASQLIAYEPFDPETVRDLELGAKTDWSLADWQMRTNVALYHQWYDDIQRTVNRINQFGVPSSVVENAAEATVLGLDIEQTLSPTDHVTLKFQYSYIDPEYEDWVDPASGTDLSATPFFFTPEHAFTATLTYSYPLEGNAGMLDFGASASWQDDVWINPLHTITAIKAHPEEIRDVLKQDDYWLLNLSAGWNEIMGSNLDITAYVKNVNDEEYAVGGVLIYHSFGTSTKVFGEPRTYGLELRYNF